MKVVFLTNTDPFERDLIIRQCDNGQRQVIGVMKHYRSTARSLLCGVDWQISPSELSDGTILFVPSQNLFNQLDKSTIEMTAGASSLTTNPAQLTPHAYMTQLFDKHCLFDLTLVSDDDYQAYDLYQRSATELDLMYEAYPVYQHIILFEHGKPVLKTLLDLIFKLPAQECHDTLLAFRFADNRLQTQHRLAEQVLKKLPSAAGQDYLTQEQQVEAFIQFSKLLANKTSEAVSDKLLDTIKASPEYRHILGQLKTAGFGISKTQQFNVLQSAAYLLKTQKLIYNLSDMGAGKTLMTVEAIYLMDLKAIRDFKRRPRADQEADIAEYLWLPSKNLIAPKLSVKSSWLETFKLFYEVTKVSDTQYQLAFTLDGMTYQSDLNVCAFTARANAVRVEAPLPEKMTRNHEYLIIDEVHQLVKRPISRRRFFTAAGVPSQNYQGFVLSGTLSNLTTSEWYHYAQWLGIPFGNRDLDELSAKGLSSYANHEDDRLHKQIKRSAQHLSSDQRRSFDTDSLTQPPMALHATVAKTAKERLFHALYSSKVLRLTSESADLQQVLLSDEYELNYDANVAAAPNFELFYQLVGNCAITAQSTQIAEELYGKQQKQHPAEVLKVPSILDATDLQLLKTLHKIASDYRIYKSPAIATAINNAILNLNDGLAAKNLYDLVNHYAKTNIRFLTYLSTLDLDLLKKLPESNLIEQPVLTQTPKFKVLQKLLKQEPDATFLIVVNDEAAAKKLGSALNLTTFTHKELRQPLDYQELLDKAFKRQAVVIVPQAMIKSSLDLVQANRLIQYQLNTEISDIIQTQNRINRIGQTRETKAYYIATDVLQENVIKLFLETYRNIRVAHKGIVELFVDMSEQVNVVNDYLTKAMDQLAPEKVETDASEVKMAAFKPEIEPSGQLALFKMPMPEAPEIDAHTSEEANADETDEDPHVIDLTPNHEQNLFSPVELATMHQLVPDF